MRHHGLYIYTYIHIPTRQMAPVAEEMLGCQILVANFILGGSKG